VVVRVLKVHQSRYAFRLVITPSDNWPARDTKHAGESYIPNGFSAAQSLLAEAAPITETFTTVGVGGWFIT